MNRLKLAGVAGLLALQPFAQAQESTDKRGYHLLHPVPAEAMRPLSTDRPDKTESAYTLDAGHFQYEGDLLSLVMSQDSEARNLDLLFAYSNLKVGLLNNLDLHLIVLPLNWTRTTRISDSISSDSWSFGDIMLRMKYNLWGNDGGATALALLPFVKLPTSTATPVDNLVEGGLVVPFAWDLGAGFGFGAQLQIDVASNQEPRSTAAQVPAAPAPASGPPGYHPEFSFAATLGYDFSEAFAGFIEIYGNLSPLSPAEPVLTFDAGMTWSPFPNQQWDLGMYLGLTPAAPVFTPFLGLSQRF